MARIIGTDNDDDSTFLQALLNGHGFVLLGNDGEDDQIYGLGGNDLMIGGTGNDYLDGGTGADTMIGGGGNDTYIVDNVDDVVDEASSTGHDEVVTFVSFTLSTRVEDLTLAATAGAINGTGNDIANEINGNDFANTLDGKDGNDTIFGKNGADTLFGGGGDDHLSGGRDNDTLLGGLNNDTLDGGSGDDQMFGGSGDDTYWVDSSGDVVSEFLGGGYDAVFSFISFTLPSGIEGLVLEDPLGIAAGLNGTGNTLDNTISGGERNNTLRGLDGNDILAGGGGNDTLFGGDDNDTLYGNEDTDTLDGGSGADEMIGGTGNDTYFVDNAGDTIEELANEGTDTVNVSNLASFTLGANLENLVLVTGTNGTGNGLGNTITGNGLDNRLDGAGGADSMVGGLGNDTYLVDNANDVVIESFNQGTLDRVQTSVSYSLSSITEVEVLETRNAAGTTAINLSGNGIDNTITGNNGQNVILGGLGNDTLRGNGGADTFRWTSTAEGNIDFTLTDTIVDFSKDQGDHIDLSAIDADTTTAGNQAFTFIGSDLFSAPGQVRFLSDKTDTFILLNTNSDGAHEMAIRISGFQVVDQDWFVL